MADLEIVHLSDLHWSSKKQADRQIVIDALLRDLKTQKANGEIAPDAVIFSGDLAGSGDNAADLLDGYNALCVPVLEILGLGNDRLFIAPGNHDIAREKVRTAQYVESGLQATLKSVDSVNDFVDNLISGSMTHLPAVERMNNYYQFVDKITPADDTPSTLLRCYSRKIGAVNLGVACFDTAWRATGEPNDVDRNRLLIGERNIDLAIETLSKCDIRVAVMHHPLEWLAEFDEYAVASRLSAHFDIICCGHTHRTIPQTRTTAQGTAILSQTGSIYASRKWFNGYHIIQVDAAKGECCFRVRTYYDSPRREFDSAVNIVTTGQICYPYTPSNKGNGIQIVEGVLREIRPAIRQSAADHMNMIGADTADITDVKEGFVAPPLSVRSESDAGEESEGAPQEEEVKPEDLLRERDNYLITGGRESGKSSLLHYLAVLAAEGNCDKPRIPVILNCSALKTGLYNLKRGVGAYLGGFSQGANFDEFLEQGKFLFLVDDLSSAAQAESIKKYIETYPDNRWLCIDRFRVGSMRRRAESAEILSTFREVTIGSLPRRSIRAMARRWSPVLGQSDDHVFETVMGQIKRDALPRTGYIVTLLLWAMQQETEFDRINEAVLLSNVVDHLLGKADFTQATRGTFDPRSKEIVLEQLATFLHEKKGVADVDATTAFLVDLFRSKRLPFKALDVISELVKCGILDRSNDDIFFKYKCFQEYFFASRMRFDQRWFQDVTKSGGYRRIGREVELLSGLRRENDEIISAILEDIETNQPLDIEVITKEDLDNLTEVKVPISVSQKRLDELKKKRLSSDQIDDLMDAADRRVLRRREKSTEGSNTSETTESDNTSLDLFGEPSSEEASSGQSTRMSTADYVISTDVLGRVVRNSDFTDFDIKGPAARAVIRNALKTCILVRKELIDLLDEALQSGNGSFIKPDERDALVSIVTRMMMLGFSSMIDDELSSPNVVPMAKEILKEHDLALGERIFLTFLLQTCRAADWDTGFGDLLNDRPDSGLVVECVLGRIQTIVNTQYLDDNENAKVRRVIDTAQEVLGWGANQKSRVLTDLRKAALQADLKDQRL